MIFPGNLSHHETHLNLPFQLAFSALFQQMQGSARLLILHRGPHPLFPVSLYWWEVLDAGEWG